MRSFNGMKRILHVIDHLGLGGAQSVLLDLVTLIDPKQWHCEVAVMHGRGFFAEALEKKGITVHVLSPSLWPPCYLSAFVRLQQQFDLFHFHLPGANALAKPLAAIVGEQPRLFHDHSSPGWRYRGFFSMMLEAVLHRFSSHTIAVSEEIKNFLWRYEALSPDEITVMLNGVNTEIFCPCSVEEKKAARTFFHLPETGEIIGTAARLVPEKNQKMLLLAARQALQKGLQATFVIAGCGPEEKNLRALTAALGISSAVRFLGQVEERHLFHRALDLFVLTSHHEGMPVALLEAMSSGVPVVTTDLKSIQSALDGGHCGTLVPCNDKDTLAQCFLKRTEMKEKAKRARIKVESAFNALHTAQQMEQIYQRLMVQK